jgi:hypothetical protein
MMGFSNLLGQHTQPIFKAWTLAFQSTHPFNFSVAVFFQICYFIYPLRTFLLSLARIIPALMLCLDDV